LIAMTPGYSLYEQLGGRNNIEAVVAEFYSRVLADPILRPIFDGIDMNHLRRHQTAFISYALGGPNQYSGRSMRIAHEGLNISETQFGAVAGHLSGSLASFDLPVSLIDQVVAHVAQLKGEIVAP
jgi:hemoglobin